MGFWNIVFLLLILATIGLGIYAFYRWRKFKKLLSHTEKMVGKRVEDLVNLPTLKGAQIPVNLPKKGEVVLYFYGPKCKLCPKQEEELKKLPKNVKVFKFDIRTKKGKIMGALFRVPILPSVVVIRDRTVKAYFTAFATKDKIVEALKGKG